jgi:hypothetical protein
MGYLINRDPRLYSSNRDRYRQIPSNLKRKIGRKCARLKRTCHRRRHLNVLGDLLMIFAIIGTARLTTAFYLQMFSFLPAIMYSNLGSIESGNLSSVSLQILILFLQHADSTWKSSILLLAKQSTQLHFIQSHLRSGLGLQILGRFVLFFGNETGALKGPPNGPTNGGATISGTFLESQTTFRDRHRAHLLPGTLSRSTAFLVYFQHSSCRSWQFLHLSSSKSCLPRFVSMIRPIWPLAVFAVDME